MRSINRIASLKGPKGVIFASVGIHLFGRLKKKEEICAAAKGKCNVKGLRLFQCAQLFALPASNLISLISTIHHFACPFILHSHSQRRIDETKANWQCHMAHTDIYNGLSSAEAFRFKRLVPWLIHIFRRRETMHSRIIALNFRLNHSPTRHQTNVFQMNSKTVGILACKNGKRVAIN